jgi:hypothetical protein
MLSNEDTSVKMLYLAVFCIAGSMIAMITTNVPFTTPSYYQSFLLGLCGELPSLPAR